MPTSPTSINVRAVHDNWLLEYTEAWHDTWEIVGAFATFVAVLVALIGFGFEAYRARQANHRADVAEAQRDAERAAADEARENFERERTERERVVQAQLVIAWPRYQRQEASTVGHWRVAIGNFSDAPIFDVFAQAIHNDAVDAEAETLLWGRARKSPLLRRLPTPR